MADRKSIRKYFLHLTNLRENMSEFFKLLPKTMFKKKQISARILVTKTLKVVFGPYFFPLIFALKALVMSNETFWPYFFSSMFIVGSTTRQWI